MSFFPMYVDLCHKNCLVVGGGNVALRKIEKLLLFKAHILVVSEQVNESIHRLVCEGHIKLLSRRFEEKDLDDVFLVIAATDDTDANHLIYQKSHDRKIPINVVDDPALCTFIFPAIVKKDDLVIGISTSGRYPALAGMLKKDIENLLPKETEYMLALLAGFRATLREKKDAEINKTQILQDLAAEMFKAAKKSRKAMNAVIACYQNRYGLEDTVGKE